MNPDNLVKKALDNFFEKDQVLIEENVHEICMVHRFAIYLENKMENKTYNVDIEYNRHLNNIKKDSIGNCRRVDLVVHQRGNDDNNYIYIEFKKNNNFDNDIDKIKRMKKIYKYKNIYIISFSERKIYKLIDDELREV